MSVSSIERQNKNEGDAEEDSESEEEVEGEAGDQGELGKRLSVPKEEGILRRGMDPLLPSKQEVEDHNLMGHCLQKLVSNIVKR